MKDFFTGEYPELVKLLNERARLADEYLGLTLRLKEALEADDMERLEACIEERGGLIKALEASGRELEAPMRLYNDYVSGLRGPDARLAAAMDALGQTRDIFMRVSGLDRDNMDAMSALMGKTADEGKKLKGSRQGVGKYAQRDVVFPPSFIDELK